MKKENSKAFKKIDKNTMLDAAKHTGVALISVIAGGTIGAMFHRASLPLGIATMATSFLVEDDNKYTKNAMLSLGAGMIVGNGMTESTEAATTQGFSGFVEDSKSKGTNFLKAMGKKASLDKIDALKSKLSLGNTPPENNEDKNYFKGRDFEEAEKKIDALIDKINSQEQPVSGADREILNMSGTSADRSKLLSGTDKDLLLGNTDRSILLQGVELVEEVED